LFDSCRLRHRQDIGLGGGGHGPFEMMGLICLGIPDRTKLRRLA
jgi:hypothetical protein